MLSKKGDSGILGGMAPLPPSKSAYDDKYDISSTVIEVRSANEIKAASCGVYSVCV